MTVTPFCIKDSSHLSPYERGVVAALRYNPKTFNLFSEDEAILSYQVNWYEKAYSADSGTVGTAWTISATTALSINAGLAARLAANYILQVEDEQVRVKSVNTSANTIDVYERGFGGTTAAVHDAASVIKVIGKAEEENTITENYHQTTKSARYNFVQEFTEDIYVSARAAKAEMKDFDDLIAEEEVAKMDTMLRYIDRTALVGRRHQDNTIGQNTTGGIRYFIEDASGVQNPIAGSTFAESDLKTFLQDLAERGSEADTLIVSPAVKKMITDFAGFTKFADVGNTSTLGFAVDSYLSDALDGRLIQIVSDPEFPRDEIYAVCTADLLWHPMQNSDGTASFLRLHDEPSDSSKVKKTLRTELAFVIRNADRMGLLSI